MNKLSIKSIFWIILLFSTILPSIIYLYSLYSLSQAQEREAKYRNEKIYESERNLLSFKLKELNFRIESIARHELVISYLNLPVELREFTSPKLMYLLKELSMKYDSILKVKILKNKKVVMNYLSKKSKKDIIELSRAIKADDEGFQTLSSKVLGEVRVYIDKNKIIDGFNEIADYSLSKDNISITRTKHGKVQLFDTKVLLLLVFQLFFLFISFMIMTQKFLKPIITRINLFKEHVNVDQLEKTENEFVLLDHYFEKFVDLSKNKIKSDIHLSLSRQLAHDIRSPLAALDMSIKSLNDIEPTRRNLIRSAINRIHDIANNLVGKQQGLESTGKREVVLLSSIVSNILSEKRTEYRGQVNVEIDYDFSSMELGMFSSVVVSDLKRVISNLINNAVEALPESGGLVEVKLKEQSSHNKILIRDNGKGISSDQLDKIFEKGVSLGKVDGTGLGLWNAKETVEAWGGTVTCKSILGKETTFIISIPKELKPEAFIDKLSLSEDQHIVIVDDDSSIHKVWQGRFSSLKFRPKDLSVFSSPNNFLAWYEKNKADNQIFFFDYEYLNFDLNGIDLASAVGDTPKFLVTSRFEEEHIREKSKKLNCSVIDKSMLGLIPITIKSKDLSYVLIDDDRLMHAHWLMDAKEQKKELTCFFTVEEFLGQREKFELGTVIFIDSNLAGDRKGEVESKKIADLGFEKIYIVTGYPVGSIDKPAWIKSIRGKRANFNDV